ncbi:MAG TPA: tetratricopeptide repeat protein [Alphaproteobacteria bacterium]
MARVRPALAGFAAAIALLAALAPPPASAQTSAGSQTQLELGRVRLLQAQGRLGEARELAGAILAREPNNAEILSTLANIEAEIGRPQRAAALYDRAARVAPGDAGVRASAAYHARNTGGFVRLDPELQFRKGGDTEYILQSLVEHPVTDAWRLFAGYDINHVDTDAVTRPTGQTGGFEGQRHRGQVGAQYAFEEGHTIRVAGHLNPETAGASAAFRFVEDDAATILSGEYRRPNWDYLELLVNDGWRNQIAIERQQRLGALFEAPSDGRLKFFVNRYGLEEIHDSARSWGFEGELSVQVGGLDSPFTVAYAVEAEYVTRKARITEQDGDVVPVIDAKSREVHELTLRYNQFLIEPSTLPGGSPESMELELYGGGAIDRLGRGGPVAGAVLTWHGPDSIDAEARADYVQNVGRDSPTSLTVGGYFIWRY